MTIKPLNNPIYIYTCDLCGKEDRGQWLPSNWEGLSIALMSSGMAQLHICQDCITESAIVRLINKVKTSE